MAEVAAPGEQGGPALLIYGASEDSAALRHEVRVAIMDSFLFARTDGRPHVMVNTLERSRIMAAVPDAELYDLNDLGLSQLRESGKPYEEIEVELASRAAAAMGLREAVVDPQFPIFVADRLRADGIELRPDPTVFAMRRRAKLGWELDGIRAAQRAAEAAMGAAAGLLRAAEIDGDALVVDGEPLLAERVRAAAREACAALGAPAPPGVIVASVHQGFGHEPGSGPLPPNLPIQVDLWPRDEATGCWADMTRTFVIGEPAEGVAEQETLVREALEAARDAARPGVSGRELHALVCDIFEGAGRLTQRNGPGDDPTEGFQFSLGHGVGLEVHEEPGLGQIGREPLIAGDVIAVEPGLWDPEIGGVRYEDLLLITENGCETLTNYPYDLAP
jgi:Xaa-Pro aminopeptidase